MIETKDYMMRIINRIGEFLRQALKGQIDTATEADVNEALEEFSGLSTTLLSSMSSQSIVSLLAKQSNPDSVALSGILLTLKARISGNVKLEEAGHVLIEQVRGMPLSTDIRTTITAIEESKS